MKVIKGAKRALGIEYAIRDVVVPASKLEKEGHKILNLNIGDPVAYDFDVPPAIKKACQKAIEDGKNFYSPSYGIPPLLDAIVKKEKAQKCDITSDDLVVTTGVTEALLLLFGAALEPKDEILVPGPTYPPYISYAKFFDANPVSYRTVEEDGWQPDIEDIRKKITKKTKCIAIINPNNPTGALYEAKTVKAMTDLAGEHGLFVISDEIYDKMTFETPNTPTASVNKDVPLVVLNGISKVYLAPGWRIGYLGFRDPQGALAQVRDGVVRQARARLCASNPMQYGYIEALTGDQSHIEVTNRTLRERRDIACQRFNEIEGLSSQRPGGAFYMFPKIEHPKLQDDKKFVLDLLMKKHVLSVHGSGFCPVYGKGHFRIVFLPPPKVLNEAMDRIEEYFKEMK